MRPASASCSIVSSSHSASFFRQLRCTNLQNLARLLRESCAGRRARFGSGVALIYDANAIVFQGLNGLHIMRDRHRTNFSTLLALLFSSSPLSLIEKMAHDSGDAFIHRSTMRARPKSRNHDRSRTQSTQKRPDRSSLDYFPRDGVIALNSDFLRSRPGIRQASGDDENSKRHLGE